MITKMTKLQAINKMLGSVQLHPVDSLLGTGDDDVETAKEILNEVTIDLLVHGWNFNTLCLDLVPNNDGIIQVPDTYIKIDAVDKSLMIAEKSGKLFNLTDNTYKFTEKLSVIIVTLDEFENLPQTARKYISLEAARNFQMEKLGDGNLDANINRQLAEAWKKLRRDQVKNIDSNFITGSAIGRYVTGGYNTSLSSVELRTR